MMNTIQLEPKKYIVDRKVIAKRERKIIFSKRNKKICNSNSIHNLDYYELYDEFEEDI